MCFYAYFLFRDHLIRFFFVESLNVNCVTRYPRRLVFYRLFRGLYGVDIRDAALRVTICNIRPFLVGLFRQVVIHGLPLFSTFRITSLPANTIRLIPQYVTTAMFNIPYINNRGPLTTSFTFL